MKLEFYLNTPMLHSNKNTFSFNTSKITKITSLMFPFKKYVTSGKKVLYPFTFKNSAYLKEKIARFLLYN